jgi:hypothetical protein
MTTGTIALIDYLRKIELELDDDWLRQMVQNFTQAVIELEAEQQIGASRHERTAGRTTQRNGYRERGLSTRVGELELRTPALAAQGQVSPSCGRGASFRACWSHAGGRKRRWWRWCSRRTSKGSAPGKWMICCWRWG